MTESDIIVAGIDVGGEKKGLHVVALKNGAYQGQFHSKNPDMVGKTTTWCRQLGVQVIAIDAPCQWSRNGRARPAERELMAKRIFCYSTPQKAQAENHPKRITTGCSMEATCTPNSP